MKYKGESYVQHCATVVIRLYISYDATCFEKLGKMVHSMKQNGFYHDNQHVSTNLAAVSAQNTRETCTCTEHNSIHTISYILQTRSSNSNGPFSHKLVT